MSNTNTSNAAREANLEIARQTLERWVEVIRTHDRIRTDAIGVTFSPETVRAWMFGPLVMQEVEHLKAVVSEFGASPELWRYLFENPHTPEGLGLSWEPQAQELARLDALIGFEGLWYSGQALSSVEYFTRRYEFTPRFVEPPRAHLFADAPEDPELRQIFPEAVKVVRIIATQAEFDAAHALDQKAIHPDSVLPSARRVDQ